VIAVDELPDGWRLCALGDVVQPSREKVEPRDFPGTPYVGLEHIEAHSRRIISHGKGADVHSTKAVFRAGDVLYGKLRPYLNKVAVPDFDGIASTDILVFPRSDELEPGFLARILNSSAFVEFAHRSSAGMQLPRTSWKVLKDVKIPVPPRAIQRRIVTQLNLADSGRTAAVTHLAQARGMLASFRTAVVRAAYSGDLTRSWRAEKYGALTEDEGPTGWKKLAIADIADCLDRLRRPVNARERSVRGGVVPYYGANGQVGWIDEALFDEKLVLVVEDETFIGRTKPFSYLISGPAWVNNHAHVLRANSAITPELLNIFLSYYDFVPLTSGSTGRKKLNQGALMKASLWLPPLDEQSEIVRTVDEALSVSEALLGRIESASGLMSRAGQAAVSSALAGKLSAVDIAVPDEDDV
jgi:type I restriction enzyme, S subunit